MKKSIHGKPGKTNGRFHTIINSKVIIKAAKNVDGVKKADWSKESHMLTIHYKKDKVEIKDVHKKIAEAGHDTSEMKADDDTYASLPGCCKYRED
ncbi:MAG: heavy-metal-associated domain-containing protein [Bacteroidales bacterium]